MALTPEELAWAEEELEDYIRENEFEYADGYRFADRDDPEECRQYEAAKRCCGEFNTEIFYRPTRKWIRIGCNYGH